MNISMLPIGILHIPFSVTEGMPIQSARTNLPGSAELLPQFAEGLEGVEEFSHLYLLYVFDRAKAPANLKVKPFLDDREHGIFATRFPLRPNLLGISVVRLIRREGNILHFLGADMLDGTPLLDVKPYIPEFDVFEVDKTGWYQHRAYL
jgi:tRNA-Thr(GGU) m(6)t(6)A37 methyltransferase TsaA